jgi:gamma-glutamyltranspeptidase
MLVRAPNGSFEFIDFRETAPAAAFQDMYKNNTEASIYGGLARYDHWQIHVPIWETRIDTL